MKLARKLALGAGIALSLAMSLVLGAALGLLHIPFRAEHSAILLFVKSTTPSIDAWKAVHLLSTSCPCSRAVSAHLIKRGVFPGVQEYVILAGKDAGLARNLIQAGFRVQSRTAEEIASRFQVPGAPWFILVSPTQEILYAGGYATDRSARSGYQDEQIWRDQVAGVSHPGLPVYGCALGRRLQKQIDPFGFKYQN